MQPKAEQGLVKWSAKELHAEYSGAVLPVVVKDKNGDPGIGSAFHVGSGSFVTARHVIEGMTDCHVEIVSFRQGRPLQESPQLSNVTVLSWSHCNLAFIQIATLMWLFSQFPACPTFPEFLWAVIWTTGLTMINLF